MNWVVVVFGALAAWMLLRALANDRETRLQTLQAAIEVQRAAERRAASESPRHSQG